jgi:hypothetical protein
MRDVRKYDGGSARALGMGPRTNVPSRCHNGPTTSGSLSKTGRVGARHRIESMIRIGTVHRRIFPRRDILRDQASVQMRLWTGLSRRVRTSCPEPRNRSEQPPACACLRRGCLVIIVYDAAV